MYGIAHIWEEMEFCRRNIKEIFKNKKMQASDKSHAIVEYQRKLSEIELKIRSDIDEYCVREQKLGKWFNKRRKSEILSKILELEGCLRELKEWQEESKNYQL